MGKNTSRSRRRKKTSKKNHIQWGQEIKIAIVTSLITLVISTIIFRNIRIFSPGEYSGERLNQHFMQVLASELHVPNGKDSITLDQIETASVSTSLSVDTIVICGTYSTEADHKKGGRYISVWERQESSFWNELFGTKPGYSLVFLETTSMSDLLPSTLKCMDCIFDDIDGDNGDDICVRFLSKFADRESTANVFLMRIDSKWSIVEPEFSEIELEILEQISDSGHVFLDDFQFCSPDNPEEKHSVFSLGMYSKQFKLENPLWGGFDHLYCIAVNNGTAILDSDYCALVMMRFSSDNQLILDPNWNNGQVYVTPYDIIDTEDKLKDLVDDTWGFQVGDVIYHGDDIR